MIKSRCTQYTIFNYSTKYVVIQEGIFAGSFEERVKITKSPILGDFVKKSFDWYKSAELEVRFPVHIVIISCVLDFGELFKRAVLIIYEVKIVIE